MFRHDKTVAVAEIAAVERLPGIANISVPPGEPYHPDYRRHLWRLHYRVTSPGGAVLEDTEEVWLGQTLHPVAGIPIHVTYRTKDGSHIRFDDTADNVHALRLAIEAATPASGG